MLAFVAHILFQQLGDFGGDAAIVRLADIVSRPPSTARGATVARRAAVAALALRVGVIDVSCASCSLDLADDFAGQESVVASEDIVA